MQALPGIAGEHDDSSVGGTPLASTTEKPTVSRQPILSDFDPFFGTYASITKGPFAAELIDPQLSSLQADKPQLLNSWPPKPLTQNP